MIIDYCSDCGRRGLLEQGLCAPCRSKVKKPEPEPEIVPSNIQVVETKFLRDRIIQFGRDEETGKEYTRFRYTSSNSGLSSSVDDGPSPDGQRRQIRDTSKNFTSWKISK